MSNGSDKGAVAVTAAPPEHSPLPYGKKQMTDADEIHSLLTTQRQLLADLANAINSLAALTSQLKHLLTGSETVTYSSSSPLRT